jgi:prenylcysteine oxidase / farnesylcysteine lyase
LIVNAYDNLLEPVELGASIFVQINEILYNATEKFHLPLKDLNKEEPGDLGVWDGDKFVYYQEEHTSTWWNYFKLFWKYGRAPYRAQKLVQQTITTFLKMYKPPYFPFRSLTTTAFMLELTKVTGVTGEQFLAANNVCHIPSCMDRGLNC